MNTSPSPSLLLGVIHAIGHFRARIQAQHGSPGKLRLSCAFGHMWAIPTDEEGKLLGEIKFPEPHVNAPQDSRDIMEAMGEIYDHSVTVDEWVEEKDGPQYRAIFGEEEEPSSLYPRLGPVYRILREDNAGELISQVLKASLDPGAPTAEWSQMGHYFKLSFPEPSDRVEKLPMGVYHIKQTPMGLILERQPKSFELPSKIYGLETKLIERVKKTFENTKGNLGVLLNGLRGTGKTVTAEMIAMDLGLPIILINEQMDGLVEFMAKIPHAVTFLCDEFEKVFPTSASSVREVVEGNVQTSAQGLLPLMDGVLATDHRKVFLLTTNNLSVERNLLQRPGRIRYLKTFGNLSRESIEMIVDDLLKEEVDRASLVDYIAQLQIITVDIVTAVVEEMNLHGGDPKELDGLFNVQRNEPKYDLTRLVAGEEDKIVQFGKPARAPLEVGGILEVHGDYYGHILSVKGEIVRVVARCYDTQDGLEKGQEATYRLKKVDIYNEESYGRGFRGDF